MAFNLFKKKEVVAPEVAAAPAVTATVSGVPPVAGGTIVRMHVSEKSNSGHADRRYVFVVVPKAAKPQVAADVARRYKVKVAKVQITKLPRKSLTVGRYRGSVAGLRKAVVTLAEGNSIPVE